MNIATHGRGERSDTRIIGWLFCLVYICHNFLMVVLPRLDKESAIRDTARGWHYAIGISLLVFGLWRLVLWLRDCGALPDGELPAPSRFRHEALALLVLGLVLLGGPLGFLYGWAEGRTIDPAGLFAIPAPIGKDHAVWQFAGYFHSAASNANILLAMLSVLSAAYTYARYGKGLLTAFPSGFGLLALTQTTLFIYAINSFRDRTPGYLAAAIVLGVVAAYWLIVRLLRRNKGDGQRTDGLTRTPIRNAATLATIFAVAGFGLTMPYLMFRVTPFATGVIIKADPSITWHKQRLTQVAWTPPTQFELTTGNQSYKWCKFCHTMEPGAAHLVGPNLANIFGQRAGSVPNFHYSPAMAAAGKKGLVWNEDTIRQFIAGPDEMVPGTSMIVSSGPTTDPKLQDAVIASLKRDTMLTAQERAAAAARFKEVAQR